MSKEQLKYHLNYILDAYLKNTVTKNNYANKYMHFIKICKVCIVIYRFKY